MPNLRLAGLPPCCPTLTECWWNSECMIRTTAGNIGRLVKESLTAVQWVTVSGHVIRAFVWWLINYWWSQGTVDHLAQCFKPETRYVFLPPFLYFDRKWWPTFLFSIFFYFCRLFCLYIILISGFQFSDYSRVQIITISRKQFIFADWDWNFQLLARLSRNVWSLAVFSSHLTTFLFVFSPATAIELTSRE